MIKFLFVGRRAAGITRQAAQAHLRDVHGPMVVAPPADAGALPGWYAQNHVVDGAYPSGTGPHAIERDLVTELHFESMASMAAATATPYYRTVLKPDEPGFVDDAGVARLNVVPYPVLEGARTRHTLFVMISRAAAVDDALWQAAQQHCADAMLGWGGISALTGHRVLPPPAGACFVDAVFEAWFADRTAAIAAVPAGVALFSAPAVDRDRSLVIVAEEYTQDRLRALHAERTG